MKPLDPFDIDLEKATLIEASAGTGKTYTITTLYCRLLAVGYPVESILVVTFTEAAAAELKLRIRKRIFHTLACLSEDPDSDEDDLVIFFNTQKKDLPLICQRLQHALICFDQASIMTIHSFCFKILKENAFESHSFFDRVLVPDRSAFLRQVSFDFFMHHVNNLDPLFLSYLSRQQITPESFIASFGQVVARPSLMLKPAAAEFKDIFDAYRNILKKIHELLLTRSGEIAKLIQNHDGIDKRSYSKKNVPAWLAASCLKLEQDGSTALFKMTEKGDALYKFTQTRLALKTKTGAVPVHALFDLCQQVLSAEDVFRTNLISLKIKFLQFFTHALEKMKKNQGNCFFDDLVNDLAAALEKEAAPVLQTEVRKRYNACLIDEFQDTDPRQYDIFSKIFSSQEKKTSFFMIGDPKQAIYAFRGGDIFAYLKASRECDQQFTLEKNYRSAPLLVNGINEIFSRSPHPFLFEFIKFSPVTTPSSARNKLLENNLTVPPLQFCFIHRDDLAKDRQGFITRDAAAGAIPRAVASDISSLLNSGRFRLSHSTSSPQKITPQDIAVLVRTNQQAEQVQKALSRVNIPSYLSKTGSVFDSAQAADLYDILSAVAQPDHMGYIKAALCTAVFKFSSDMIAALDEHQDAVYVWQERFRRYKDLWNTKGFVSMIMALLHSGEAFLKGKAGLDERGLTNFYHLVELIAQTCLNRKMSPYYVIKWYARQLTADLRDESFDELRLETDKKSVAIVTVHKSKGLEYPVVYLPFLWEGERALPKKNVLFHDPRKGYGLTLDLGSEDLSCSQAQFEAEERAEQRRLLYVALTRASAMCRIIWGGFTSVETSALGSLLHQNGCAGDRSMLDDLEQVKSSSGHSILVQSHLPGSSDTVIRQAGEQHSVLSARKISREISAAWKMSSFSAITHSFDGEIGQNREFSKEAAMTSPITLAHFPKGAGSGDFFHSVYEVLDFTKGFDEISQTVHSLSDRFGFLDRDMVQLAEASVKQVLETSLISGASGFCLKDIPVQHRFNEMEFIFPVKEFHLAGVKKILEQSALTVTTYGYVKKLSQLTVSSFKGFIKGFIDLVIHHRGKWYIVDYKSNYLGDSYDQYSQAAMVEAMCDHHYFLQYHLYLVALHRYLGLRLKGYDYDTDFGGVFYLFIRGMHPESGSRYGVFYDRPAKDIIQKLSDMLSYEKKEPTE